MNTCATTRLLVPATLIAVLVASLTNSDVAALVAGLVTAGAIRLFQRLGGRASSSACALTPTSAQAERGPDQAGGHSKVTPVRSSETAHSRSASSSR